MAAKRHLRNGLLLKLAVILGLPLLVILLPVLLPFVALSVAWDEHRLARTPCPNCGHRFGRAEVRRAKRAAGAGLRALIPRSMRTRVVAVWRLVCPNCGAAYDHRRGDPPDALAPVEQAPG